MRGFPLVSIYENPWKGADRCSFSQEIPVFDVIYNFITVYT
jgi:hypothetical protein